MQAKCMAVLPSAASCSVATATVGPVLGQLCLGKAGNLPTLSKGFLMLTPVATLLMCLPRQHQ